MSGFEQSIGVKVAENGYLLQSVLQRGGIADFVAKRPIRLNECIKCQFSWHACRPERKWFWSRPPILAIIPSGPSDAVIGFFRRTGYLTRILCKFGKVVA